MGRSFVLGTPGEVWLQWKHSSDGEQHDTLPLQEKTVGELISISSLPQHGRQSQTPLGRVIQGRSLAEGSDAANALHLEFDAKW